MLYIYWAILFPQDKGGLSIFPCLRAIYEDVVMNSALCYTHVYLEELTPVNFFQDYCDINEIKIWPSLVGEKKGEKELEFSFFLCSVHRLEWDHTLHSSFLWGLQQGQQQSPSIWLQCNKKHFRWSGSFSSTSEILTATTSSCGFAVSQHYLLPQKQWETEAGRVVSSWV